ncbi:MAG TPA: pitrilysin family protein [Solirubrobacterales bacterium]|nr:pitrilysin family protein [Solirubrobacterales bacterium]
MATAVKPAPRVTALESGLTVVSEPVPSVRSIALGLWVRTGSRDEPVELAGVSHFLEHLLFKGTARHSAIDISELLDGLGAAVNAGTGKETTNLYARFLDHHLEAVLDTLAEMFLAPTYPEIDSEREVVIEEIAMYEDEPSDRVHDHLAEAIFGDQPLGRRVLGEAEVIGSVPVEQIAAFHDQRYLAPSVVVSAAGNVDHDELVALSERLMRFPAANGGSPSAAASAAAATGDSDAAAEVHGTPAPAGHSPRLRFQAKETEQYHICFGGPGLPRGDDRRFVMAVLDSILGGSTSSRLFREIREKRGLAYAVASFNESYTETGLAATYVGTREDNVAEACEVIGAELTRMGSEPVSDDELARAREQVKGRLVLSSESTSARMSRNARSVLFELPLESLDEMIERVDAVTVEQVAELAAEVYRPETLSAAAIGRDADLFKGALAPVNPSLLVDA